MDPDDARALVPESRRPTGLNGLTVKVLDVVATKHESCATVIPAKPAPECLSRGAGSSVLTRAFKATVQRHWVPACAGTTKAACIWRILLGYNVLTIDG